MSFFSPSLLLSSNQQNWRNGKKGFTEIHWSTVKLFYCIIKVFAQNPQRLLSLSRSHHCRICLPYIYIYIWWWCPFRRKCAEYPLALLLCNWDNEMNRILCARQNVKWQWKWSFDWQTYKRHKETERHK